MGQAIENNARMGLFIDGKAHKGMNSKHAAERVRQFLFDYGDLTTFESESVRMLSRFYTFTRKNTALQARIMMTQPGNIHNAERITEEFTNQVMGLTGRLTGTSGFDEEGRAEAGRMDDSGLKIPDWVQPTLGLYRNEDGKVVVAGVDSPFVAGADTVDALAAFLKLPAAWGLMQAADSDFQKDQRTELFRD
ncbi:MAG: hypothetical protein GY937_27650, partial [bacterium]|nr:hypothetical protein [bacterium]